MMNPARADREGKVMGLRHAGWVVLLSVLLVCQTAGADGSQTQSIARLSWLAGCWERAAGERQVEEQWMRPRGGTMLGMSRTVTGGRTSEFEHMRIREE